MTAPRIVLARLYREWSAVPFDWGAANCLHWGSACALALTGRDPVADLHVRYTGLAGIRRGMKAEGWADMGEVAAARLPEIPIAQARSGDWAHVVDDQGHEGLGVVLGPMLMVRTESGMGQMPLLSAKRAFRVG